MTVKIIPITDAYRKNWDRIFRRSATVEHPAVNRTVEGSSPSAGARVIGPIIWPYDGRGGMMDYTLPETWGMVDGGVV